MEVSIREGEYKDSLLHHIQRIVQISRSRSEVKANRHLLSKRETVRMDAYELPLQSMIMVIGELVGD
jgi:hypothetical protein